MVKSQKEEASTAVAVKSSAAEIAELNLLMEQYVGAGKEGMEKITLIPRTTILQALSPQCQRSKAEYDPAAKPGMIYEVGTKRLFTGAIHILPVHWELVWVEWAPRETQQRGPVNQYRDESVVKEITKPDDRGRLVTKDGNNIVKSAHFYALNLDADLSRTFLPMQSTQFKKARNWATEVMGEHMKMSDGTLRSAPFFYRTYRLSTVAESNPRGSWDGWKIDKGDLISDLDNYRQILQEAIAFRKVLIEGKVRGEIVSDDVAVEHGEDAM